MSAPTLATAARRHVSSNALVNFWRSTIGKKVVMAVTGLIMAGFLVTHAAANLLSYAGPTKINAYSHFLHEAVEVLWPARIVLFASFVLHIVSAAQLTRVSQGARPVGYTGRDPQVSTMAARTIRWGGVLLLLFIVFHILHLTIGTVHPSFQPGDPYANIVTGLQVKWVAGFYIVMMVVLGLHLYHGTWSAFRTLGIARPSAHPLRRHAATIFALALWLGFTLVPVGVLVGIIR